MVAFVVVDLIVAGLVVKDSVETTLAIVIVIDLLAGSVEALPE
jgi:hypothetical protein